jgi:hypothetical protein
MVFISKQVAIILTDISHRHTLISDLLSQAHCDFSSPPQSSFSLSSNLMEEIKSNLSILQQSDCKLLSLCSSSSSLPDFSSLRRGLQAIKRLMVENSAKIKRDLKKANLILAEYKERCRSGFVEYLKTMDIDLRKALKPLVPNNVLQEQLKFKPINPEHLFSGSLNSHQDEEKPSENTVDKLNNHIQLLINTLETVAKDLIAMTQNTSQRYYELVDPLALYSEPPSPLAAPLPDYFSYDLANLPHEEEEYEKAPMAISEQTKKRLLDKLSSIENGRDKSCNPALALRIHEKLLHLFENDIKEIDLMELFKEEGVPVTDRENIVFEMINTDRTKGNDVSLEDIIDANLKTKNNPFEVSRTDYSDVLKKIEGKELTDKFEDLSEVGSLQSSIDERVNRVPKKAGMASQQSLYLAKMSLVRSKEKQSLRDNSKPSLKDVKLRASTPSKPGVKIAGKRSHTPGLKKKKRS